MADYIARGLVVSAMVTLLWNMAAARGADTISRDFWKPDSAAWGDGREAFPPSEAHPPHGYRNDYGVDVPATGWYTLRLAGAPAGYRQDVLVNGVLAWRYGATDAKGKAGNLWLAAGKQTIRVQRMGINGASHDVFDRLELAPSPTDGTGSVQASKTLVDVIRAGETLKIQVTAGGNGQAARYEIFSADQQNPTAAPQLVGTVNVTAGASPVTQTVEIPCPVEGIFTLTAKCDGKPLSVAEFAVENYAVVDVKRAAAGDGKKQSVFDIDCVAQTINGAPVDPDRFIECNGPTRVSKSAAGMYRETHDCTPPAAPVPPTTNEMAGSFSGFSYRLDLPSMQEPYLVSIDYPDDARRSVTITLNSIDPVTRRLPPDTGYSGKSYETGGMFPLTFTMQTHQAVIWPTTRTLLIGLLSQSIGDRGAAAHIRVERFADGRLPAGVLSRPGGRVFMDWYEEAGSWRFLVGMINQKSLMYRDFVGLDRWAQLARFNGVNSLSGMGIGYQDAFFRTGLLPGMKSSGYDACRLLALICEKYGMAYVPEVYYSQWYIENKTLPEQVGNDDDFRAFNCSGGKVGSAAAPCTFNPLHPAVQKLWMDALGEMADKLRDSPAFAGITVRADEWGFRGEYTFPSENWGYGDWTIRQFEKDSALSVPGGPSDAATHPSASTAQRYQQRYAFLMSPEIKPKWIAWREHRLLDYHERLLTRIRGDRKDIYFGIIGNFDADPIYQHANRFVDRAAGAGVDLAARQKIDGLPIFPVSRYGTRNTNVSDQKIYDDFFDPEIVQSGMGQPRGFSAYMVYHELAQTWPAAKLGIALNKKEKPPYYCSAVLGAGRHSLEKFAAVPAEQDSSLLRDGGNVDVFANPAITGPWLAEYHALPAAPFDRVPGAYDPVAVWQKDMSDAPNRPVGFAAGLYFYAVNREQYPIAIDIELSHADTVTQLGTQQSLPTRQNILSLVLQPYELRSFLAPPGAVIVKTTAHVPADRIALLREHVSLAQTLAGKMQTSLAGLLTDAEQQAFREKLDQAWRSLSVGDVWHARTALRSAPMMLAYLRAGDIPTDQAVRQFPNLMPDLKNGGHWQLGEPRIDAANLVMRDADGKEVPLSPSTAFNANWSGMSVRDSGSDEISIQLNVPAEGVYTLELGHVARSVGSAIVEVAGQTRPQLVTTSVVGSPETAILPQIELKGGLTTIVLRRRGGIGIYGVKLLPLVQPMPDGAWLVCGPFPTPWSTTVGTHDESFVKRAFEQVYPPEKDSNSTATYKLEEGTEIGWLKGANGVAGQSQIADRGVSMTIRTQSPGAQINFAQTTLRSDRDRTAILYLAVDWWAQAFLNGERLTSTLSDSVREATGSDFTTHYPSNYAVLHLKKGDNVLLVKQHGGSLNSALVGFVSRDAGLEVLKP